METLSELEALGHTKIPILRAIRKNCIECNGENDRFIATCPITRCALYPFRMGSNPFFNGGKKMQLSEKQKANAGKARKARGFS